jgi:hypothetical protein
MRATLTDQNILDIIVTAGYGIAYWAARATVDKEARTYAVWYYDGDEDPAYAVATFDELAEAYNKLLENEPKLVGDWLHKYFLYSYADRTDEAIDCGHIDADAADVMVQVALFGKVIYG